MEIKLAAINGRKKWIVIAATVGLGLAVAWGVVSPETASKWSSLYDMPLFDWALIAAVGHTLVKWLKGDKSNL